MLNTKPIKTNNNSLENRIPNLSSDTKNPNNPNNSNNSSKVIQLENSKQEELKKIVKEANNDNNELSANNQNNSNNEIGINNLDEKQIGGIGNDAHNNAYIQNPVLNREFTYDRYKDANLNVSNLIDGNKMFIGNTEKNNININDNIMNNIIDNKNNLIKTNHYGEFAEIKWNDVLNCFVIYNISENSIECKIYNEN